jgi:hypothetical protein
LAVFKKAGKSAFAAAHSLDQTPESNGNFFTPALQTLEFQSANKNANQPESARRRFGCFVDDNHQQSIAIARVYLDFDRVRFNSANRRRANLREHVLLMFGTGRKSNQVLWTTKRAFQELKRF